MSRMIGLFLAVLIACSYGQTCTLTDNTDYATDDNGSSGLVVTLYGLASASACCTSCSTIQECVHFAWTKNSASPNYQQCRIYNANAQTSTNSNVTSGTTSRAAYKYASTCNSNSFVSNSDYNNGFITSYYGVANSSACCNLCQNYATCNYFTFVTSGGGCYLKGSNSAPVTSSGATTGSVVTAQTVATRVGKRGIGWFNSLTCSDLQKLTNVAWIYNWGPQPDAAILQCILNLGMEYIPMQWGSPLNLPLIYTGAKYLLTFNEPNFASQSNLLPSAAANLWPQIQTFANQHGMKISSPAAAAGGVPDPISWLDEFFSNCTALYGSSGCQVDFITTHIYTNSAPGVGGFLSTFKKYNLPIWLTEVSIPDTASPAVAQQFMSDTLNILENDSAYARYAWFGTRIAPSDTWLTPNVNIFDNTQSALTALGVAYNSYNTSTTTSSSTSTTKAGTTATTGSTSTTKAGTTATTGSTSTTKAGTTATTGSTSTTKAGTTATTGSTSTTKAGTTSTTKSGTTSTTGTTTGSSSTTGSAASTGYIGCYVDSTSARDLTVNGPATSATTVEKCRYWCGERHYNFSGLQYADECRCGNTYGSLGVAASTDCNMACAGNSSEICGAGNRNSIWNSGDVGYLGCYVDGSNGRDLTYSSSSSSTQTIDSCRQACSAASYAYAGLQYGQECWCGNTYGSQGKAVETDCNMACTGDSTEICGAGNRNSIFKSMALSAYPGY